MGTGIPRRFRGVSFDRKPICDLDPPVLRDVRAFIRDIDDNLAEGRGRWFFGDVGTGKGLPRPLERDRGVRASDLQEPGDRPHVPDRQLRAAVQHRPHVAVHRLVEPAGAVHRRGGGSMRCTPW